jgi:beta-lactam-binding protein with PASTA domain
VNWRGQSRRLLMYSVVAASGFLTSYLVVALLIFPPRSAPGETKVPGVIGLNYDDAVQQLAQAGFKAKKGEMRFKEYIPAQTVLTQTPAPGTVDQRGAVVILDVSGGERLSEVPPIIGLTQEAAQKALEEVGLQLGIIEQRPNNAPRGAVLEASPDVGKKVPPATAVKLIVSSGPNELLTPDVVGQNLPAARAMLEQLGLQVGEIAIDSTSTAGSSMVLSQSPAAGQPVAPGARVNLKVSGGSL